MNFLIGLNEIVLYNEFGTIKEKYPSLFITEEIIFSINNPNKLILYSKDAE
jgi:hypothetical protein